MTTAALPVPLDIFEARRRLAPFLRPAPLLYSEWLSSCTNAEVHLKVESLQPTHSFKIRGALNALLKVSEEARRRRREMPVVVTASAGNHGRAMATAAARLGVRLIVFTPVTAPDTKKDAIRRQGAELRDEVPDYDAAEHAARAYASTNSALYVSSYNHPDVIAGAGTAALEIIEALPSLDVVVVPIGGGGLASGMGIALKAVAPHVTIIGVETKASTAFAVSLARGVITEIKPLPSLADGLTGNLEPGSMTFELVRRHVDRVVSVSETDLERAIRELATEEHLIAEGAGAAAPAAVLSRLAVDAGQRSAVMLTGGNIDQSRFISVAATAESPPGSGDSARDARAGRE